MGDSLLPYRKRPRFLNTFSFGKSLFVRLDCPRSFGIDLCLWVGYSIDELVDVGLAFLQKLAPAIEVVLDTG